MGKFWTYLNPRADGLFLVITAIALAQLCHTTMNWFFAGIIGLAYYVLFRTVYSRAMEKHQQASETTSSNLS